MSLEHSFKRGPVKISLLTVVTELYGPFLKSSLIGRAQAHNIFECGVVSFRDYAQPKERIDAPPFGPGAGMLLKPVVVERAIADQERQHGTAYKIFFSPHGERLTQEVAQRVAQRAQDYGHLMLIAGRYEGMDARVEEHYADEIISLGDFVVMGGDLPAMLFLEAVVRLIPGVVGKQESVEKESFTGAFVDHPHYTEPLEWQGMTVPDIVRSGNHAAIEAWRNDQAAERTVLHHFQWLRSSSMHESEKKIAQEHIPPHYVALMHTDVVVGKERQVGCTSVTTLDIHDIARSSATYGIEQFFVVTPLFDQQKIVHTLLEFWQKGEGVTYNPSRHQALTAVELAADLEQVVNAIAVKEQKKPLVIGTSARTAPALREITYYDQQLVWAERRPVLFLLGTGQGLSEQCLQKCDYILLPIEGFTSFNHLSVRSAAAIILDRWLGINQKRI